MIGSVICEYDDANRLLAFGHRQADGTKRPRIEYVWSADITVDTPIEKLDYGGANPTNTAVTMSDDDQQRLIVEQGGLNGSEVALHRCLAARCRHLLIQLAVSPLVLKYALRYLQPLLQVGHSFRELACICPTRGFHCGRQVAPKLDQSRRLHDLLGLGVALAAELIFLQPSRPLHDGGGEFNSQTVVIQAKRSSDRSRTRPLHVQQCCRDFAGLPASECAHPRSFRRLSATTHLCDTGAQPSPLSTVSLCFPFPKHLDFLSV